MLTAAQQMSWCLSGQDAAFDVTVVHPLQDPTVVRAANEPRHALNFAHDRKQGIALLPLKAKSLVGWYP